MTRKLSLMTTASSLSSIDVSGLFGSLNYKIVLDPERPTVLTGANGTGKSTILRLVSAISNGELSRLAAAPIDGLTLNISGMPNFALSRSSDFHGFEVRWGDKFGQIAVSAHLEELPEWALSLLENRQFDTEFVLDELTDAAQAVGSPFEEYRLAREILLSAERTGPLLRAPDWLGEFGQAFPVLFVSDQRLVTESKSRPRAGSVPRNAASAKTTALAVEVASTELSHRIREADSDYARSSQQLDRRLPQKLIAAMSRPRSVSGKTLDDLVVQAAERREALKSVGLLDVGHLEPDFSLEAVQDENVRRVMEVVIRSTLDKLAVLDDLQSRLSSFKSFLDDRFYPKTIDLNRNEGIRFRLPDGQRIRSRQLSSGEQQMMVLAFEILFRSRPGTLVIVDEPELSLHILWQDTLIRDLQRMGDASGVQFLMATHSPVILADYPELERPLGKSSS